MHRTEGLRLRGRPRQTLALGVLAIAGALSGGVSATAVAAEQNRAWELVSPAEATAGAVAFPYTRFDVPTPGGQNAAISRVSTDGNAATYFSYTPFGDPRTGLVASFRSVRTDAGWVTRMWSPATKMEHPNLFGGKTLIADTSDDLRVGISATDDPLDPLDQDPAGAAAFDVYQIAPDGGATWLSRANDDLPDSAAGGAAYGNRSADASVILFQSGNQLTPNAATVVAGSSMLYRRVDGRTELAGVDDRSAPISACGAVIGGRGASTDPTPRQGEVSADGTRYTFTAPDPLGQYTVGDPSCFDPLKLYVRDRDATIDIGRSQRSVADPGGTQPVAFQGATVDLSSIYFVSAEALTDDAPLGVGGILYRYDFSSRALTLISAPGASNARVTAIPDDGSVVYYVADVAGVSTLFRYGDGANAVVASFPTFPPDSNAGTYLAGPRSAARTTPDGRYLAVLARENLTSFDSHGFAEIYRYDSQTRDVICISCNTLGAAPIGDSAFGGEPARFGDEPSQGARNHGITSDGQTVFFESKDALSSRDDNGTFDVYEWIAGSGARLISDGRTKDGSFLFDTADDGRDVFIATTARLVGWDVDNGDYDLYDARRGGGFAEPTKTPALCRDDQCQGQPTAAPELLQSQSTRIDGESPPSVRAPTIGLKVKFTASSRSLLKSGRIVVVVSGRRGTTVVTRLQAKLGRRTASSAARTKLSAKTGSARVSLRVPTKLLRSWRLHGGTLTLRVVGTGNGKSGSRTLRIPRGVSRKGTR